MRRHRRRRISPIRVLLSEDDSFARLSEPRTDARRITDKARRITEEGRIDRERERESNERIKDSERAQQRRNYEDTEEWSISSKKRKKGSEDNKDQETKRHQALP
jgi:hypothetical protein